MKLLKENIVKANYGNHPHIVDEQERKLNELASAMNISKSIG